MRNEARHLEARIAKLEARRAAMDSEHAKRLSALLATIDTLKRAREECASHALDCGLSDNGILPELVAQVVEELHPSLESLENAQAREDIYRQVRDRLHTEHQELNLRGLHFTVTRILKERASKLG